MSVNDPETSSLTHPATPACWHARQPKHGNSICCQVHSYGHDNNRFNKIMLSLGKSSCWEMAVFRLRTEPAERSPDSLSSPPVYASSSRCNLGNSGTNKESFEKRWGSHAVFRNHSAYRRMIPKNSMSSPYFLEILLVSA